MAKLENRILDYKMFPDKDIDVSDCQIFADKDISVSEEEYKEEGLSSYIKENLACGGCLLFIILFPINFFIIGHIISSITLEIYPQIEKYAFLHYPLLLGIAVLVIFQIRYIFKLFHRRKIKKEKLEFEERRRKRKEEKMKENIVKAKEATSRALRIYKDSSEMVLKLPQLLDRSSGWLDEASTEYKANAYAPFWDAMEKSANCLFDFRKIIHELSEKKRYYYETLQDRNHDFPEFPVKPELLPNPAPVIERFYELLRMGQTNFEFAVIWEHRKTREVLIAGFKTLGDAIEYLGSIVKFSVAHLELSIRRDFAIYVDKNLNLAEGIDKQIKKLEKKYQGY